MGEIIAPAITSYIKELKVRPRTFPRLLIAQVNILILLTAVWWAYALDLQGHTRPPLPL